MELNFEELNNINLTDISLTNTSLTSANNISTNYWENKNTNTNTNTTQKKPRVSYDDILSSLNMVVQNGVLRFANPTPKTNPKINPKINYKEELEPLETKPLTKEEQKELYIKRQQELKRISEIKSKKLLFNTQNISIAPRQNTNLNKLFPMFKK